MKESIIQRFIVWYLLKHNVKFEYAGYVVRMFSKEWYEEQIPQIGKEAKNG